MRLWSLHPGYLDTRALVACWREGLLARSVLRNQTKGYRHHPQLARFRAQPRPVAALDSYLLAIYQEAVLRGFAFNRGKIGPRFSKAKIRVTAGQLDYELRHLRAKLKVRDRDRYRQLAGVAAPRPHPGFRVVTGAIEPWERVR